MVDWILLGLLLIVGGSLMWMERERLLAAVGADSTMLDAVEPTVTDQKATTPGYFWSLARPAGLNPERSWLPFVVGKLVLAALALALALSFELALFSLLLAVVASFFLPDALLWWVRRERQASIRRDLSFFLDLIVSMLHAGLTLEEAFKRAAREGLNSERPLAEEAKLVADELEIGRDRTAGFQALAERTAVRDLRGLASALTLGLGSGVSVEATLKAQAELARAKRREEGLRRIQVASAEVLLPLLLCAFPVFIVLTVVPLFIQVLRTLQGPVLQ